MAIVPARHGHGTGTTWLDMMGHEHGEARRPTVPCLIVSSCRCVGTSTALRRL
jgi:hypothetical protein